VYSSVLPFMKIELKNKLLWFFRAHLFALFWNAATLLAASHFLITAASIFWYYENKNGKVKTPLLRGIWMLVRYHLGSVVFGGLLLAIVWGIRVVFEYYIVNYDLNCRKI